MPNPLELGHVFYHVKVTGDISDDLIMLWADDCQSSLDGSLTFTNHTPDGKHHFTGLIIPPGCWKLAYAAMPTLDPLSELPLVTTHWERE